MLYRLRVVPSSSCSFQTRRISCVLKGKTGGNSERGGSGVALTGAIATFFLPFFPVLRSSPALTAAV